LLCGDFVFTIRRVSFASGKNIVIRRDCTTVVVDTPGCENATSTATTCKFQCTTGKALLHFPKTVIYSTRMQST